MNDNDELKEDYESLHPGMKLQRFYDWKTYFPFLQKVLDNIDVFIAEMKAIEGWSLWPEPLYDPSKGELLSVFPFLHTIPGNDPSKARWVTKSCEKCPKSAEVLKEIPGIITAIFSNMGPDTIMKPHQGWAPLANHTLRCHVPIFIPELGASGIWCDGLMRPHLPGQVVVFDENIAHMGFNTGKYPRCVLIIDIKRPDGIPPGISTTSSSAELKAMIDFFG